MIVTKYTDPWEHYIVDDFLDESTFDMVQATIEQFPRANPKEQETLFLKKSGYHAIYQAIYDTYVEYIRDYVDPNILDTNIRMEYSSCGNGFVYNIHRDHVAKIFSFVFYVSEEGTGTSLYDASGQTLVKEVEWKPNRAFAFFRGEDTFHSYHSNVDNRQTVNCWASNQ